MADMLDRKTYERDHFIHDTAMEAYYRERLSGPINRERRIKAAIDAVRPLIAADALRAAARHREMPAGSSARLRVWADEAELGEAASPVEGGGEQPDA